MRSFTEYYNQLLRQGRRTAPTAFEARRDFYAALRQQVLPFGNLL